MAARPSADAPATKPVAAPHWTRTGPELFGQVYLALFVVAALLTYAVHSPRENGMAWMAAGWVAFAAVTWVGATGRAVFHDWLASLTLAGRVWFSVSMGVTFVVPAAIAGLRVIPDGFVFLLLVLVPFAMNAAAMRALIACVVTAFWFALGAEPAGGLGLVLAYGLAVLWLLGASHFAFVGQPFGLRGWWPVRRVWRAAVLYCLPAGVAAAAAYEVWPWRSGADGPRLIGRLRPSRSLEVEPLTTEELTRFFIETGLALVAVLMSLVLLYFLRRFLARGAKPADLPPIRGADVSELELFEVETKSPTPQLDGARGEIVRLWWRWAKRHQTAGAGHTPGETARELADRVARESEGESPPKDLTQLLEQAHYGPRPPTRAEVEAMRRVVRTELEKKS